MIAGGLKIYSGLWKKSQIDLRRQYVQEESTSTQKIIVPMKTIENNNKPSVKSKTISRNGDGLSYSTSVDFKTSMLPSNMTSGVNGSKTASNMGNISTFGKHEDDEISTTNGEVVMPFESGMRTSGKNGSTEGVIAGASGVSGITSGATITPPFGAPKTSNGTILVDPSTDPKPEEQIPVGEGVGILLLLIATYGVSKKMRL